MANFYNDPELTPYIRQQLEALRKESQPEVEFQNQLKQFQESGDEQVKDFQANRNEIDLSTQNYPKSMQDVAVPPSVESKMNEKQAEKERMESILSQINQYKALKEGSGKILSGLEKASAAYAGGGLTQIKPDTQVYDDMAKEAGVQAEKQYAELDKMEAARKAQEAAAIEKLRQDKATNIYKEYLAKTQGIPKESLDALNISELLGLKKDILPKQLTEAEKVGFGLKEKGLGLQERGLGLQEDKFGFEKLKDTEDRYTDIASAQLYKPMLEKMGIEIPEGVNLRNPDDIYKFVTVQNQLKKSLGTEGRLSNDPNSEESKAAQEQAIASYEANDVSYNPEAIKKLSAATLGGKLFTTTASKGTPKISKERENRLKEKQAWQISEKDEISDKQLESITSLENTKLLIQRIRDLKDKVNTGVYSQMTHSLGKYTGGQNLDQADLTALVGTNLAEYIKGISGAAVSEEEAQRLARNIPNMEDDDKVFNRKLENFDKTLDDILKLRMVNMEKYQGKNLQDRRMVGKSGLTTEERQKRIQELKSKSGK